MTPMRIVFMGTPEFAVAPLQAMLDAGYFVAAVFTQPDRPSGRGNKVTACPVKLLAESRGIPVYQFERVRRQEGLDALRVLKPDLVVTAAFGQILSQKLLDVPPLGTVNVHASLLPRHRGAAPINWAIAMGDRETGVTTMFTDAGVDTGDMIFAEKIDIRDGETAGQLSERLMHLGGKVLLRTLEAIEKGNCPRTKQDESQMTHEPMLDKAVGELDFTESAEVIARKVRAFNPWPGCYIKTPQGHLKIWAAKAVDADASGVAGEVIAANAKQGLIIKCGEGAISVTEMQAPNAKKIGAAAYLAGKPMKTGVKIDEIEA